MDPRACPEPPAAVSAQAAIEGGLTLITPVSKFIHDAALNAFAEYAKEKYNVTVKVNAIPAGTPVGASGPRSFRDVTLPLIWRGVLVGSLFSFVTSLQEASAVLFLSLGGWETIPVGIFAFYIAGSANEAAALG